MIVPITVLFAGGAFDADDMAVPGRFLTTVDVLPSLDSLITLTLRPVRVAGLAGGGAATPFFVPLEAVDVAL